MSKYATAKQEIKVKEANITIESVINSSETPIQPSAQPDIKPPMPSQSNLKERLVILYEEPFKDDEMKTIHLVSKDDLFVLDKFSVSKSLQELLAICTILLVDIRDDSNLNWWARQKDYIKEEKPKDVYIVYKVSTKSTLVNVKDIHEELNCDYINKDFKSASVDFSGYLYDVLSNSICKKKVITPSYCCC